MSDRITYKQAQEALAALEQELAEKDKQIATYHDRLEALYARQANVTTVDAEWILDVRVALAGLTQDIPKEVTAYRAQVRREALEKAAIGPTMWVPYSQQHGYDWLGLTQDQGECFDLIEGYEWRKVRALASEEESE